MFMVGALQVQAYRATANRQYADRGALFLVTYGEMLQQPNGLFRHGNESPFHWGRGNGWVASGMAETLRSLPPDHPRFDTLLAQYRKMMAALLEHQGEDGMWRQIIDDPDFWPETSCSAMFTFAMIVGVNNGWLDTAYAEAARKGWIAVCSYLDEGANLTEVCVGTGQSEDRQFYMDRPRHTGDLHGQAPVIWCANALLRHAASKGNAGTK
jgi:rhamnogalacturonyl hydrolase YesR